MGNFSLVWGGLSVVLKEPSKAVYPNCHTRFEHDFAHFNEFNGINLSEASPCITDEWFAIKIRQFHSARVAERLMSLSLRVCG